MRPTTRTARLVLGADATVDRGDVPGSRWTLTDLTGGSTPLTAPNRPLVGQLDGV
ncbi:hypothetical protein Misp04_61450 [Micromonospora sp. NBRC 101691]|nr:hypothetical protein Misp04_61450 [Micromonospora sp. NBRC 101691]